MATLYRSEEKHKGRKKRHCLRKNGNNWGKQNVLMVSASLGVWYVSNHTKCLGVCRLHVFLCCTYLLFLSFLSNMALLQAHSSEEVSEVTKQGDNPITQVCHHRHIHGWLFKRVMAELPGANADLWDIFLFNERAT